MADSMTATISQNFHCYWRRTGAALLILFGLGAAAARGQLLVRNRIVAPIRSDQMQIVKGTVHPLVSVAQDEGPLSGATQIQGMALVFRLSAAQQADLKDLLKEQQAKGTPMYRQWLRPGEFAARYGVSRQDLMKVSAWLQSRGFTITAVPASADRIVFSGTAAQVNAAFQTQMHRYTLRGQSHWANATPISVPQAIAAMTLRVAHLTTFRPRPHFTRRRVYKTQSNASASLKPRFTLCNSSQNPCPAGDIVNFIAPSDTQTIYDIGGLYNSNFTGSGQTMAVVGQTDIMQYQSDIKNFRALSGLDASNLPKQIVAPGTGAVVASPGDLEEADIDVEWSGAVAKDASILYVTSGNTGNVFDALQYAIQNPLVNGNTQYVPVISLSYGNCEKNFASATIQSIEQLLEQANSQGQTVVIASGDSGSADCDTSGQNSSGTFVGATQGLAVDYPASSQYATAVGGTSFSGDVNNQSAYWNTTNNADNGSAMGYIPETTWNNTPTLADLQNIQTLSASGGGASNCTASTGNPPNNSCTGGFSKPSWQTGPGVPSDGKRDVPDVALDADANHDGYVLCTDQTNSTGTQLTGTSTCAYPVSGNEVPYFEANGTGFLYGGTSIAAPQMAAMITLWNQEAGNSSGVGNANPVLYLSAKNTPGAFHDVTTSGNAVVCQQRSPNCVSNGSGGYVLSCCSAGSGYDTATGLGSVDAAALGKVWPQITGVNSSFSLQLNPAVVSVSPGSSQSTSLVLSPSGGFNGTVNLACSNLPSGVTCGFSSSSVALNSGAQQTVTLTISASSSAAATSMAKRSIPGPLSHPPGPLSRGWPMQTAFAGVLGLCLFGIRRKRRLFPSRWMAVLLLVGGLMAATALTACGSGSPNNTGGGGGNPLTQKVTVTGTSGKTTASASIQLTVT